MMSLYVWNLILVGMKVGTGKFRTDRHRISYILIKYRNYRKKRNQENIQENPANSGTGAVWVISWPNFRLPHFNGNFPVCIPVFIFESILRALAAHRPTKLPAQRGRLCIVQAVWLVFIAHLSYSLLRDNEVGLNLRATRRYLLDCWSICMSTSVSVRAVVQPHRPDKEHRRHFGRVTASQATRAIWRPNRR